MTPTETVIQAANYHMTKAWERQAQGRNPVPSANERFQVWAAYDLTCKGDHTEAAYRLALIGR